MEYKYHNYNEYLVVLPLGTKLVGTKLDQNIFLSYTNALILFRITDNLFRISILADFKYDKDKKLAIEILGMVGLNFTENHVGFLIPDEPTNFLLTLKGI